MRARHRMLTFVFALVLALLPATAAMAQVGEIEDGPLLTMWERGDAVAEWQSAINEWLEQYPQGIELIAVDGIYGPITEGTTRDFQSWADITVDGIVGPETRGAMAGALHDVPTPPDEPAPDGELSADEVLSPNINTDPDLGDGETPMVAVTDVTTGTHDGFDRVTFDIGGEGLAGWDVRYVDEATAAGSGHPIDVEGDAVLSVTLTNIALPTESPVDPWDGPERIDVRGDGPAVEVVEDTVFEGRYTFFIGVDEVTPFQARRFEDPQRIVVDIAA